MSSPNTGSQQASWWLCFGRRLVRLQAGERSTLPAAGSTRAQEPAGRQGGQARGVANERKAAPSPHQTRDLTEPARRLSASFGTSHRSVPLSRSASQRVIAEFTAKERAEPSKSAPLILPPSPPPRRRRREPRLRACKIVGCTDSAFGQTRQAAGRKFCYHRSCSNRNRGARRFPDFRASQPH